MKGNAHPIEIKYVANDYASRQIFTFNTAGLFIFSFPSIGLSPSNNQTEDAIKM